MAPKSDASRSSRTTTRGHKSDKYIHVHFYENYRWGAWVREPKVGGARLYVGTHMTEKLAARCQDRALLKLEMEMGSSATHPIKLNFDRQDYDEDKHMRSTLATDDFFKYLRGESRMRYNTFRATACLTKFMDEERSLGNLAPEGASAICAPKPASKNSTSKLPKSTNEKQKKPKYKEYSNDYHYRSEFEGDKSHEVVSPENNMAIDPYVHAPESLASIGKRQRRPVDTVWMEDEKEAFEALLLLGAALRTKKSRHN